MTTNHTPGPWAAVEHGVICEKCTSHGNFYVCGLIDPDNDEDKANARLIAAAPELLEALKSVLEIGAGGVIERRETGKPTWHALDEVANIARNAIAKATATGGKAK